jgi:tetratricopeptide (TPR) repeat protein
MIQKPASHPESPRFRAALIERETIALILGALVSIVLIVLAIRSLIGSTERSADSISETTTSESSSAPIQTIEQVLESVQVYVSSEDYPPAIAILKSAIARYPLDVDLRFALGDLYMMTQEYPLAYEQYVAAIEHSEGTLPEAQFTAGTLANMIDQPEMALVHYQTALDAAPNNADYALYLANIQFKLNKLDEAKASLAIAARLAPDRAMVFGTWAQIALRQNKLSIASQQIDKARQLEPTNSAWIILDAKIQKRLGDPDRAIELLTSLTDSSLDDPEAMKLLAESFGMVGRLEEAASRMIDYATRHNEDAQAAFDAAIWSQRAKLMKEARQWGRRARDLGHPRAQAWLDSLPD